VQITIKNYVHVFQLETNNANLSSQVQVKLFHVFVNLCKLVKLYSFIHGTGNVQTTNKLTAGTGASVYYICIKYTPNLTVPGAETKTE